MDWLINFTRSSLLQEFIIVVFGVLVAHPIQKYLDHRRYGNWRVIIEKAGGQLLGKSVSPGKVKAILEVPEDMGVFLKGLVSPFEWVNCDLIDDGPKLGLLIMDKQNRRIVINLDKNPEKQTPPSTTESTP